MKRLLPLQLLLISYLTHAQPLVLNDPNQSYPLFEQFSALEVRPGTVSIDSLLQQPDRYRFTPIKQQGLTVGHSYWLRLELTNTTHQLFALRIFLLSFNRMILYETDNKRVINQRDLALLVTDTTDYFQHSKRLWTLHLGQGRTHTVYVYIDQIWATTLPIYAQANLLLLRESHREDLLYGFFYGFVLIVMLYSLILFMRLGDRDNLLYAIWVFLTGFGISLSSGQEVELSSQTHNLYFTFNPVIIPLVGLIHLLFLIFFLPLRRVARGWYKFGLVLGGFYIFTAVAQLALIILNNQYPNPGPLLTLIDGLFSLFIGLVAYRKGFRPALYIVIGTVVLYGFGWNYVLLLFNKVPFNFWTFNSMAIGSGLEILIFTLAMGSKVNLLKQHQDEAIQEQLRLTQENQTLIETQNRVLEEKVEERTAQLKASQAQLIQKEKLASLGELTAGIAHEIQNPLNFVNNFAEVSSELVEEQKQALIDGDLDEAGFIADDLRQNLTKIAHHGRRASAIVKGMLEHSNGDSGEKQETDLIRLTEECYKIAFQGYRSKHQDFSCELQTSFQPDSLPIQVITQDMGRVLINLLNNAFYSVHKRSQQQKVGYTPQIELCIEAHNGHIELRIKDNGTGIPDAIKPKIFQPFFTTKPTGEGTGLGLSLSYDIVTKGHGGTMTVESQEGEGTQFIITLPC
ncbi:sensor histidine kinase [Spirosoma aerolatum]|uniref:sensor histidine kinase n=1 Tax=Spirosoma aerolatum TaxID=1211326 RepID=UPI0009AC9B74|nr:7TM diverse intracellular signaling domain-containing protein [Spirosoma aerolatum]